MVETFRTIGMPSEGLYKEKGSKFLSFAEPVGGLAEVKERLEHYRKTYHDARHVCFAYRVREEKEEAFELVCRSSDDGEPSGTAGRPILGRLESLQLENVLVVVVRYFGGILLGTGGLVVAYREATADALSHAEIIDREVMLRRVIRFPYEQMNDIMKRIKDTNAKIIRQDWENGESVIEYEINKAYGTI